MSGRPFDPAQWEEAARQGWDSAAPGWKQWASTIEAGAHGVNERLLDMARLEAGQKVLDIATGYGEPLVSALERIGPAGSAVATDLSPEMLALTRDRVAALGFTNVAFHETSGETLNIPETGFDAALCRWGLMLMADPDACLQRVHALLKPGGRVAMAVFSEPQHSPWLAIAGMTVRREVGVGPPSPGEPNIFRLADAVDLQRRFRMAGFSEIALEQVRGTCVYDSPEVYTRFMRDVARDIVRLLEGQTSERQEAVWGSVAEAVRPYQGTNGEVRLGFECHCIAARKPPVD